LKSDINLLPDVVILFVKCRDCIRL